MAKFLLETDKVSSASDAISKVESKVTDVASNVSGWDTSNEDGFNFDGAKNIISSNIDAIASKIKNTALALNMIVESHTELQNTLRLDAKAQSPQETTDDTATNTNDTGYVPSGGTTGGYTTSGGTGGSRSGGYSPSPSSKPKPRLAPVVPVAPNVKEKEEREKVEEEKKTQQTVQPDNQPTTDNSQETTPETTPEKEVVPEETTAEEARVDDISYAVPKQEQLSEESKELFNNDVSYDDSGYSKIDDRYVIAADPSLGRVGDVVKFTDNNGNTAEYIIGVNTVTETNKNKMYFLVEENKTSVSPLNVNVDITSSKAENLGNYKNVNTTTNGVAAVAAGSVSNANSGITAESSIGEDTDEVEGDDSNG